jgi:hypothetical protein
MHFWRKIDCHYSFMHENQMDMNHQFFHRGIMGTIIALLDHQQGRLASPLQFERTAGKQPRCPVLMRTPEEARVAGAASSGS